MNSIKFSIANNAVTHLGRNLYSTTPPALAELARIAGQKGGRKSRRGPAKKETNNDNSN